MLIIKNIFYDIQYDNICIRVYDQTGQYIFIFLFFLTLLNILI